VATLAQAFPSGFRRSESGIGLFLDLALIHAPSPRGKGHASLEVEGSRLLVHRCRSRRRSGTDQEATHPIGAPSDRGIGVQPKLSRLHAVRPPCVLPQLPVASSDHCLGDGIDFGTNCPAGVVREVQDDFPYLRFSELAIGERRGKLYL
jgi:hypothetical protein